MKRALAKILFLIFPFLADPKLFRVRAAGFTGTLDEFQAKFQRIEAQCSELVLKYVNDVEPARFHVAPEWHPDNAGELIRFLNSASGRILVERLKAMTSAVCIAGCQDPMHTTHSAGVGAGWDECVKKLLEHATISRVSRVEDTNQNDEQAPEGEEQLLERMSP